MTTPQQNASTNGQQHQRIIGLTGGIGMGKTTISNYLLAEYQIPVLDADIIARDIVVPGSLVLNRIVERYGPAMLAPDGQLDRMQLGKIVFNSPPERHWLEQQIHPLVRDRFEHDLQTASLRLEPIIVLVIPLLFEARMTDLVNEIWVVFCTPEQQVERLLQRSISTINGNSQLNRSQVKKRIESQMPIARKLQHADVVLDNSHSEQRLFQQIDRAIKYGGALCPDLTKDG
ncbi:MAG: dephospho-CoA kinase [Leptolyngbyaceae bacterium]|nr:dephospho-CoA kinase [Leptolyngbyaceae bacterium]